MDPAHSLEDVVRLLLQEGRGNTARREVHPFCIICRASVQPSGPLVPPLPVITCSKCSGKACLECVPMATPQGTWTCPPCQFREKIPYKCPLLGSSGGGSPYPFDRRPLLIITFCSTDITAHYIAQHILMQCQPFWIGSKKNVRVSDYMEVAFTPETLHLGIQAVEISDWLSIYPEGRIVVLFGGQPHSWARTKASGASAFNPLELLWNNVTARDFGRIFKRECAAVLLMDGEPDLGAKITQKWEGRSLIKYGRLFDWFLGFSGYLVPFEHIVPVAEFLGQVFFSRPTANAIMSLCRSYSEYRTVLNTTDLILVTHVQPEPAGIQQVVYGPKARMPYGIPPYRCTCGLNPLNWYFRPGHIPVCKCGTAGLFKPAKDTQSYQDRELYISHSALP